jgi:hypothetical protein
MTLFLELLFLGGFFFGESKERHRAITSFLGLFMKANSRDTKSKSAPLRHPKLWITSQNHQFNMTLLFFLLLIERLRTV